MAHFKDRDPETGRPFKEVPLKSASSEQSYLEQISPYVQAKSDREKGSIYKKVELFWQHQLLKVLNQWRYIKLLLTHMLCMPL